MRMKENRWISCSESEPRELEEDEVLLIAYRIESEWQFWTYDNCPFGWSTLSRSDAWYKIIKGPNSESKI